MTFANVHNVGALISGRVSLLTSTADAAQAGAYVDRQGFQSAKLLVPYRAVLAAGEELTLTVVVNDATSAAGAGAAPYAPPAPRGIPVPQGFGPAVVATGGAGGTTEVGVAEVDIDLVSARRFVNAVATFGTAAAGTVIGGAIFVMGGADTLPAA